MDKNKFSYREFSFKGKDVEGIFFTDDYDQEAVKKILKDSYGYENLSVVEKKSKKE